MTDISYLAVHLASLGRMVHKDITETPADPDDQALLCLLHGAIHQATMLCYATLTYRRTHSRCACGATASATYQDGPICDQCDSLRVAALTAMEES